MKYFVFFFAAFHFLLMISCAENKKDRASTITVDFSKAQAYYRKQLATSIAYLDSMSHVAANSPMAKTYFVGAREAFKKAEPYASYLNPEVGHKTNGPALPIFKDDSGIVIDPLGLQKIEENVYDGIKDTAVYLHDIKMTKGLMMNLYGYLEDKKLNAKRFFIATHQQLLRIISFSITGFDTPVSLMGLKEAAISLQSLKDVYEMAVEETVLLKNPELDVEFAENINRAIGFLNTNTDYNTFDRYTFIRDYMNPITTNWVFIRKESGLWDGKHNNSPFNFNAPTFFENNTFNTAYFVPPNTRNTDKKVIVLGEKLFKDTRLSSAGNMACITCHNPDKGYADGLKLAIDNTGGEQKRNTPTLLNSVYQKGFFWDGRSTNLVEQITSVFNNEKEFDRAIHQISIDILKDTTYQKAFKDVFGYMPKGNAEIIKALSAYVSTLHSFNSKFDKNMRKEKSNFTEDEKLGMNLFMGKALCATCHFIPLTNGTVPPFYAETEKEVIGVPKTVANDKLDDDTGFYWEFNEPLHKGMFKTPTVRNVEITPPYMHNGVYETLEQVVDFYNKGGGAGLGFDLEHQTLPFDSLELTDIEQKAIVSFMKTLTDDIVEANY